jgi:hypothetical protein
VIKTVQSLLERFLHKALIDKRFSSSWELFKFEVSKYLRAYGSSIFKAKRAEEEKLISEITKITQKTPENVTESEIESLIIQQNKLDVL